MSRLYTVFLILTLFFFSYEFLALNQVIAAPSVLAWGAEQIDWLKGYEISTRPGSDLTYFLGWLGFGIMCLTNFYILRKRAGLLSRHGSSSGWLNFHIFCGLLGPLLICFHTNFKIEGLVAISFWSMVISASSGIIGRYFYVQVLTEKSALNHALDGLKTRLTSVLPGHGVTEPIPVLLDRAATYAGGVPGEQLTQIGVLSALTRSVVGDLRSFFSKFQFPQGLSRELEDSIRKYAILKRKRDYLDAFGKVMGYWHAFHLPFAIFMYIIAVIHIVSASLFRVRH